MSEIKRFTLTLDCNEVAHTFVSLQLDSAGPYVLFTDHEAAIIKAKIEVLEEVLGSIFLRDRITKKIAQLQAQLGGKG